MTEYFFKNDSYRFIRGGRGRLQHFLPNWSYYINTQESQPKLTSIERVIRQLEFHLGLKFHI